MQQKKTRTWKGRSKLGCDICKRRRIKCDETKPDCKNCTKAGFQCDGPKTSLRIDNGTSATAQESSSIPPTTSRLVSPPLLKLYTAVSLTPGRTRFENQTFQRYFSLLMPLISAGGSINREFWVRSVCAVAQNEESIFDAFLGLVAIYTIPRFEIKSASSSRASENIKRRYLTAIEWYVRSMNASRKAAEGLPSADRLAVLTLGAVIYYYCELRLGHFQNVNSVLRSAFSLLYHSRDTLVRSGDRVLLSTLYELLYAPVIQEINNSIIPEEHRRAVTTIALASNARLEHRGGYFLIFEIVTLMWDVSDICSGKIPLEGNNIDIRLESWYQDFLEEVKKPDRTLDSHQHHAMLRTQLHAFRYGMKVKNPQLEEDLGYILMKMEAWANNLRRCAVMPVWELDFRVLPRCVMIAWYWREESVLRRVTHLLRGFDRQLILVQNSLRYIQTLINTEHGEPTGLEFELFGGCPKVLQYRQAHACTRSLALVSPSPITPPASAPTSAATEELTVGSVWLKDSVEQPLPVFENDNLKTFVI